MLKISQFISGEANCYQNSWNYLPVNFNVADCTLKILKYVIVLFTSFTVILLFLVTGFLLR